LCSGGRPGCKKRLTAVLRRLYCIFSVEPSNLSLTSSRFSFVCWAMCCFVHGDFSFFFGIARGFLWVCLFGCYSHVLVSLVRHIPSPPPSCSSGDETAVEHRVAKRKGSGEQQERAAVSVFLTFQRRFFFQSWSCRVGFRVAGRSAGATMNGWARRGSLGIRIWLCLVGAREGGCFHVCWRAGGTCDAMWYR